MSWKFGAFGVMILATSAGSAIAQTTEFDYYRNTRPTVVAAGATQPSQIQRVSAEEAVVDDAAVAPPAMSYAPQIDSYSAAGCCDTGCDSGCAGNGCCSSGHCGGGCSLFGCCPHEDAWTLFTPCEGSRLKLGGWLNGGYIYNGQGSGTTTAPMGFTNPSNEFIMNQVWGFAEVEVDSSGSEWQMGFRADYIFGTDANDTQSFGDQEGDFKWNSSGYYGSALPQAYLQFGGNDWTVKVGHFYTIIGYEVVQATGNFFYSHAYTMVYGEPFTHTGVLVSKEHCGVTYTAGYTNGWDSWFDNVLDAHTFLGGISAPIGDKVTFNWACSAGQFGDGSIRTDGTPGAVGDIYMNSFVIDVQVTDKINYVFQHDYGVNNAGAGNAATGAPGGVGEWYGINQYLFYTANDCWKYGARFEWWRDDDGFRTGNEGDYYDFTIGANYSPNANLTVRPELRWDRFSGGAVTPYDNGTSNQLFTAAVDFIVTY
ncbi:porin [Lignipirellula cremea]|uniref:Porin n=1 Tax=Lignipirellula cremea TaxID=2528010 RepID=A0A518DY14_9BACT|nr:porin [Lignipirellula cremea]QDU96724.1 hypothetical protein Pla8534_45450 [Lignipirellula cremea]